MGCDPRASGRPEMIVPIMNFRLTEDVVAGSLAFKRNAVAYLICTKIKALLFKP